MTAYYDKVRKHWRYEFIYHKKRYGGRGFKTRRAALDAEADRRRELKEEELLAEVQEPQEDPNTVSLFDLAEQYLTHCRAAKGRNTYTYKKAAWTRFLEFMGEDKHLPADTLTRPQVKAYLRERARAGNDKANRDLKDIRGAFTWAIEEDILTCANPCSNIRDLPTDPHVPNVPSHNHVAKVRLLASGSDRDFIDLIIYLVGRLGEVRSLRWEDVNFRRGGMFKHGWARLWTRKARSGERKAQYKPLGEKSRAILKRRFEKRDKQSPYVFWDLSKTRIRYLLDTLCEKAEVPRFTWHALRHYAASLAAESGEDILSIQLLLGHERVSTTDKYLHRIGLAVRGGVASIEEAVAKQEKDAQEAQKKEGKNEIHAQSHAHPQKKSPPEKD